MIYVWKTSMSQWLVQPERTHGYSVRQACLRHRGKPGNLFRRARTAVYYRRQKCGVNRINTVKISSRPTSMAKVHTQV